jgi:site-specific recombinase XerC
VLKEAWRLGLMGAEEYQRAVDVANVVGSRLPAGRHVDDGELVALVGACQRDPSPSGVRDAALMAMSFTGGRRLAELVGLDLDDYDDTEGSLRVLGKGNKERKAYLQNGGLTAVRAWLQLRGDESGALFCPVSQTGEVDVRRMTGQAVYMRFRKRADEAQLAKFSPHDGRRTWIGNLLDRGADIATVQGMAGHASVTTTARYDRRPEEAKRKAAGLLHFPYR